MGKAAEAAAAAKLAGTNADEIAHYNEMYLKGEIQRDTWASLVAATRTGDANRPAGTAAKTDEINKLLPGKVEKQTAEIKVLGSLDATRRQTIEESKQRVEESKARIKAGFARSSGGSGRGGGGGGGKSAGTGGKPVTMNQINQHRIALESYDKSLEEAEVALDMKLSENALDVQALYDMVNIKNERKKVAKERLLRYAQKPRPRSRGRKVWVQACNPQGAFVLR